MRGIKLTPTTAAIIVRPMGSMVEILEVIPVTIGCSKSLVNIFFSPFIDI